MFVYAIGPEAGPFKIGKATDPVIRLSDLQIGNHAPLIIVCSIEITGDAHAVEQHTHWLLRNHRINGEWFSVTAKEAQDAIILASAQVPNSMRPCTRQWTIKGFSRELREVVIAAARAQNQTAAEWLERAIKRQIDLETWPNTKRMPYQSLRTDHLKKTEADAA